MLQWLLRRVAPKGSSPRGRLTARLAVCNLRAGGQVGGPVEPAETAVTVDCARQRQRVRRLASEHREVVGEGVLAASQPLDGTAARHADRVRRTVFERSRVRIDRFFVAAGGDQQVAEFLLNRIIRGSTGGA